jgi:hypothetical protein
MARLKKHLVHLGGDLSFDFGCNQLDSECRVENNEMKTPMDYARRPKTVKALQGLMKDVLMREAIEKDNRLNKVK